MQIDLCQAAMPLVAALQQCADRDDAPFYTPGHKRGRSIATGLKAAWGDRVFRADLPELPGLDNLFAPEAAIQAAQELAAQAFGADRTWFLVNGSTCGVVAAMLATCAAGDKIILPRNCHQSAITGLILSGAQPIFVQPEYDPLRDLAHGVQPETIALALSQHPDAKAVLLLYPTYYGTCSDLVTIAQQVHEHGIPLLVDEAHGAHFGFHPGLPTAALAAGADLAVQSTHKTLSALTQAAMLHLQGPRVSPLRVSGALQLLQSTSPNYLLLASLDAARQQMALEGTQRLEQVLQLAEQARSQIQQIPDLSLLNPEDAFSSGFYALDLTRLTVSVAGLGIDGFAADEWLRDRCAVVAELPTWQHLTFILSIGNIAQDVERLVAALRQLPRGSGTPTCSILPSPDSANSPVLTPPPLSPRQAFFAAVETRAIAQAVNEISAELICPYPPGIPVLMPGERVTAAAIARLRQVQAAGGVISGATDPSLNTLRIVNPEL
jgi:arginine decarboxylase